MQTDPALAQNLRLVSLSFDPQHDTPEVMQLYANNFRQGGGEGRWRFATTRSQEQLAPVLQDTRLVFETGPAALRLEFDTPSGPRVLV